MANVSSSNSLGERVPKLRFPGFEGGWDFEIFSDLFTFLSNNTLSRAELSEAGNIRNIHYGDILVKYAAVVNIDDEIIPFVSNASESRVRCGMLRTGDVIIADTAEDATVGKAIEIINYNNKPVVSGLHTMPCRPNRDFIASFLGYYINSNAYHSQLYPYMQGIKVTSISKANIGKTLIHFPSRSEQKKIVGLFNLIEKKILIQKKLVKALKLYKRGLLSKLFPQKGESVPQYRFAGFTDAWEQRKLGDLYAAIGNAFVGTATPYYVEHGHFYLESNNVKDGQINHNSEIFINDEFYEKQKDKWLHTGDVVMVQSGHVGHAAVIPEELDNTAAHALIMFRNPKTNTEPYFMNYQYQTDKSKKKIENITTGNTIKHILASDMQNFVVDVPKYEEQKAIGDYFSTLDRLITLHQRKYNSYKKEKLALLQQMFI